MSTSDAAITEKTWRNQLPLLLAGGIVSIMVAAAVSFGGRVVTGGESSAVLNSQVATLIEENREQRKLLLELNRQAGELYTRREAREDREASERRFQSMESRMGEIGRRLEVVEANQRLYQQLLIENSKPQRRP